MKAPIDRWYRVLLVVAPAYFLLHALVAAASVVAWVVAALLAEAATTVWLLRRAALSRSRRPLEPARLRPLP